MRARTRRPTHPGAVIRLDYMEPLGLSVTALAERLGVSRKHLSGIFSNRRVSSLARAMPARQAVLAGAANY